MYGYPYWWGPPGYSPPPSATNAPTIDEKIKELKAIKKLLTKEDRKKVGDKKKEDEEWIRIPKPPKPKTFTTMQMMLILTALFPLIGPMYYLAVVSSWYVLKSGMLAMLGN